MKRARIAYIVSTSVVALLFLGTAFTCLTHNPKSAARFHELGYPRYVMDILGTANLAAVLFLVTPKWPRIKEWVYTGLMIDLIGAMWSHFVVQGPRVAALVLVPIALVTVSYITYHRIKTGAESIA